MPLFFSDPVAATLFWISCGAWVVLELGLILRDRRAEVTRTTADRGSLRLLTSAICVALLVAFVAAFWLTNLRITTSGWAPLVIGLMLIWVGIGLRLWAVRTLGHYFTRVVMVKAGQRVVSGGPYRVIRHPPTQRH